MIKSIRNGGDIVVEVQGRQPELFVELIMLTKVIKKLAAKKIW